MTLMFNDYDTYELDPPETLDNFIRRPAPQKMDLMTFGLLDRLVILKKLFLDEEIFLDLTVQTCKF